MVDTAICTNRTIAATTSNPKRQRHSSMALRVFVFHLHAAIYRMAAALARSEPCKGVCRNKPGARHNPILLTRRPVKYDDWRVLLKQERSITRVTADGLECKPCHAIG